MQFIAVSLVILLFANCSKKPETITLYGFIEETKYLEMLTKQYNRTHRKKNSTMRFVKIEATQLRHVLENNMERQNFYVLVTDFNLIRKAGQPYLIELIPTYRIEIREDKLNWVGKDILRLTNNYGIPLYVYDFLTPKGAGVATLAIPQKGFKPEFLETLLDVIQYFVQSQVNAQALVFGYIPTYSDASQALLLDREREILSEQILSMTTLDEDLQPSLNAFNLHLY